MNILSSEELYELRGGISITGTLLSSFSKAINTLFNIGRSLGSSLYMIINKVKC